MCSQSAVFSKLQILQLFLLVAVVSAIPPSRLAGSCNSCVCGVQGRSNRIVGGRVSSPHEQPWMAALRHKDEFYCGATLISRNFVITAAHCVLPFNPADVRIYLGGHEISRDYTEVRRVKAVFDHEYFDVVSYNNDIALIQLDRPVQFGPKIQPACLPFDGKTDYTGAKTLVAGWGRVVENGLASSVLRSVAIPVWSQQQCKEAGYGPTKITENMMCGGFHDGGKDACQGDSGGPMLHMGASGSIEVIGVVSWGRGCARPNFPGIYTKISNYMPWVKKKLGKECLCQPKNAISNDYLDYILNQFY